MLPADAQPLCGYVVMATDVPRVYKLYQYGSEKYYNLRS
jgi:hypothetical protein